ncbi:DUF928 domain-containing protein [Pseudanabaena sp. UWO311]|nr:DUF928 domain-containing protein [Pseudanabaena sp. UWO311]
MTTMTSTKTRIKNSIKNAISISTVCIATIASSSIFVPSTFAQYGLGLPKSAGLGGATRGDLPLLTILVPDDGGKTLSSRPTFYWYIAPPDVTPTDSTTVPQIDNGKSPFQVTFILRDSNGRESKPIFMAEGKGEQSGLYKFTLPENAPELVKGKVQRWQIRWQGNGGTAQVDVNAAIRYDDDPVLVKEIATAKNDLEKAKIYAKKAYWYDAIDAYTSWLSKNPKDEVANAERSNLLKVGLQNHRAFAKVNTEEFDPAKFAKFLSKFDESKGAISIALQHKPLR